MKLIIGKNNRAQNRVGSQHVRYPVRYLDSKGRACLVHQHFQNVLGLSKSDVVLIGDFNCDLLAVTHDCYTKRLINICNGFNYVQLITEPTRVTETTESLLDHVYVTNEENVSISGVIHTGLSDHSLVYACIGKSKKVPTQSHKLKTSRSFSKFNEDDFINDIRKADWKSVKYDCVNKSVDEFEELFTNIADKHAPMKTKRVRKKQSPWLNDDSIALTGGNWQK